MAWILSGWTKLFAACVLVLAILFYYCVNAEEQVVPPQQAAEPAREGAPWIETYVDHAEVEAIYGGEGDEITPQAARDLLLELTNESRADEGLSKLAWDEDLEKLAAEHANDMTTQRYINHHDLEGRKCELRYNIMSGTDQVSENIAYYEIHDAIYLTEKLVRRMHQHWLDSESHRLNIMEQAHTHLGAEFSVVRGDGVSYVAGAVEFKNDYGDYVRLPLNARPGEILELTGQLDTSRARLAYIGIGSEDLPMPRTVEYQMTHIGGYTVPIPAMHLLPVGDALADTPEEWRYVRPIVQYDATSGSFSGDLIIRSNWPAAAYYVTVWAVPPDALTPDGRPDYSQAFCAMTQIVLVKPGVTFR